MIACTCTNVTASLPACGFAGAIAIASASAPSAAVPPNGGQTTFFAWHLLDNAAK
jgi:hypothetical protein